MNPRTRNGWIFLSSFLTEIVLVTEVSDYGEKLSKITLVFPETEESRESFQCVKMFEQGKQKSQSQILQSLVIYWQDKNHWLQIEIWEISLKHKKNHFVLWEWLNGLTWVDPGYPGWSQNNSIFHIRRGSQLPLSPVLESTKDRPEIKWVFWTRAGFSWPLPWGICSSANHHLNEESLPNTQPDPPLVQFHDIPLGLVAITRKKR